MLEWTLHYCNKIKVGDLSLTKEDYLAKLVEEFEKTAKEYNERQEVLNSKFSAISDAELIKELQKRTRHQTIKLSMYADNQSIFIEGKDIECESGTTFPIEIKKN